MSTPALPAVPSLGGVARWSLLLFAITGACTVTARALPHEALSVALDLVPFTGAVIIGALVAAQLTKARAARVVIWCMAYSCAACALVGALGTAHLVSVAAEAMRVPFVYDFRFYSLMLLGLLFIVPGYLGVVAAARLLGATGSSMRWLMLVWCAVLCVDLPLIPIQGFAILFSALAAIGLLALYVLHRTFSRTGCE